MTVASDLYRAQDAHWPRSNDESAGVEVAVGAQRYLKRLDMTEEGQATMNRTIKLWSVKLFAIAAVFFVIITSAPSLSAIPAFARKYKTACATCHSNWPELNDFGRAFKINGFKFPKDDDTFVKDPPLMLGAEAQKESFPHSIYPGEMPILPIAFRYAGYASYTSPQPPSVSAAPGNVYIPKTELFAPDTVTILAAGNFGSSVAFWIDDDLSAGGSGADGGLGDGYIKANDFLGHFLHVPQNDLNIRFGQFELDLPFTQARTINLSDYAIYDQMASVNPSGDGPLTGTTANPFNFASTQRGVELGGYPNRGYTWWTVALVDGANSSGAINHKDVYINLGQRFDLERNSEVRKEVQASGPTGVHDHTSIRFNAFAYIGNNELNQGESLYPGLPTIHEPFYRAGGAFNYKFRSNFSLWGLYLHAHDDNKMIDSTGTVFVSAAPVTYSGGFLEAEYWVYPWLIGTMRYDGVNSPTDRQNGISRYDTRNIYSPGLQILVRPNIKLELQYSFNYQQPVPGLDTFYRANQFLAGVDFVF